MISKVVRWAALAVILAPLAAAAEPISFEQAANVTGLAGIEVGANVEYAYEKVVNNGVTLNEQTLTDVPVFVRVGIPILEAQLSMPYGAVKQTAAGAPSNDYSGIKDLGVMVKTGLLTLPVFAFALGVEATFPTGDPMKYLGEGLDINPFVAADIDLMMLKLHANVGYQVRGEYNVTVTTAGPTQQFKVKPGDDFHWALGLELPATEAFSLHAEFLGDTFGTVTSDGISIPDSNISTVYVVPGVRLHAGPLKAKLGVEIPVSLQNDRPLYAPRADWKVIGGLALQFSL